VRCEQQRRSATIMGVSARLARTSRAPGRATGSTASPARPRNEDRSGVYTSPRQSRPRAAAGGRHGALHRLRNTDLPGVLTFAHIHIQDLALLPVSDASRVFCLCWHHHHGCYDQGYISTLELLQAEEIWIQNRRRPKPHPRDIAMMRRVKKVT
jgi:hypothetical protein